VENSGKNNFWWKTQAKIIFGGKLGQKFFLVENLGKNDFWWKTRAKIIFGGKQLPPP
jgi:hypothetical protein